MSITVTRNKRINLFIYTFSSFYTLKTKATSGETKWISVDDKNKSRTKCKNVIYLLEMAYSLSISLKRSKLSIKPREDEG